MLNIPPEEQAQIDKYLIETAKILRKYRIHLVSFIM
jgi:hypothetical protein